MNVPDYVEEVALETSHCNLVCLKRANLEMPASQSPIVICVLRNEGSRIADFLRHYRWLGVERFVFIDNDSSDGTREFLTREEDVDIYLAESTFHWKRKQGWVNRIISECGYDRWYMHVDADEHMVYDNFEEMPLIEYVLTLEKRGIRRVRAFLLDMYSEGPVCRYEYSPEERLVERFPLFDPLFSYREKHFKQLISFKGGVRKRVFGHGLDEFNPEMTKYPLVRIGRHEILANPHHAWPYEENFVSGRLAALMHFKFMPDFLRICEESVLAGQYWGQSAEYRVYHKALEEKPELSLTFLGTREYGGSRDLVREGLLSSLR